MGTCTILHVKHSQMACLLKKNFGCCMLPLRGGCSGGCGGDGGGGGNGCGGGGGCGGVLR